MAVQWLVLEEMLERGDPAFVDALRAESDADDLGKFAPRWLNDRRREARRLLLEYLDRPLNAYRHEALVKRLFKLAEKAGDDEVMAAFLVAFDRSIRRVRRRKYFYNPRTRRGSEGEIVRAPHNAMPRGKITGWFSWFAPEQARSMLLNQRLFSVHTRNYLRRRSWRYFRAIGRSDPDRYVAAVTAALKRYTDADIPDGLALLDNWGLIHILFHHCPALKARPHGWMVEPGRSLAELAPAPMFESAWQQSPARLLELLKEARCRPVRQWVLKLIERDHGALIARLPLAELLALLGHEDGDVVAIAAEALRLAPGLDHLSLDRWLELLEVKQPLALDVICELMAKYLQPERLTLELAVKLARNRVLPVARLGFGFLKHKAPATELECRSLLDLSDAESEPVRPEMMRWVRGILRRSPHFQISWVLVLLDCRHADVRKEGWDWFQDEARTRDEVEIWRRLLESPFDDIRVKLLAALEKKVSERGGRWLDNGPLDPEMIRLLWASVLLNIHRGNRSKPAVVRQLVSRLSRKTDEAGALLPMLSVALRSVRGPEWRAGLAGVVQLVQRRPDLETAVRQEFPELKLA